MPGTLGLLALEGTLLGLSWAYHRLTDKPKETPVPEREEFAIPLTAEGSAIPHVFGRVRIRRPILAAASEPDVNLLAPIFYSMSMYFVMGVGFEDGTQKLHTIWAGDAALSVPAGFTSPELEDLTGDGGFEAPAYQGYTWNDPDNFILGLVEFLNGNTSQELVGAAFPHTPTTEAGKRMSAYAGGPTSIPGYRGMLSAMLFGSGGDGTEFITGQSPSIPGYSFEVSSYPSPPLYLQKIGDDANPVDVLMRILTGGMGMLGMPLAWLEYESFRAAAEVVHFEGNGYSRAVTEHLNAQELLADVLRQIDAVLFIHPTTGKINLKLIRYDYNSRDIPEINPDNCSGLEAFEAGGLVGLPNKVRVKFTNRAYEYSAGSAQTHSFVAAAGQSAQGAEIELDYPGCHTQDLADALAARELEARSRPLTKCTAIVARDLFETACPGDVRWLRWPEYGVNLLMRIGNIDRGGRDDNSIKLDLIQEFFQVHRFESDGTGLPTHPGGVVE